MDGIVILMDGDVFQMGLYYILFVWISFSGVFFRRRFSSVIPKTARSYMPLGFPQVPRAPRGVCHQLGRRGQGPLQPDDRLHRHLE